MVQTELVVEPYTVRTALLSFLDSVAIYAILVIALISIISHGNLADTCIAIELFHIRFQSDSKVPISTIL